MILVVGSAGSGKLEYVMSLGYMKDDLSEDIAADKPVLIALEQAVARDPEGCMAQLDAIAARQVVVCNEVGSGVIPAEPAERAAREQTGRLCILLARRADKVVRMVCGIPTVLKG